MTKLRIKQRDRDDILIEVDVTSGLNLTWAGGGTRLSLFDLLSIDVEDPPVAVPEPVSNRRPWAADGRNGYEVLTDDGRVVRRVELKVESSSLGAFAYEADLPLEPEVA
jgi:uncharacterized membrane protein